MGKHQAELYGPDAILGRWLESKNTMEVINDILFVHGGIHPDIGSFDYSIETMNEIVRRNYRQVFFTKPAPGDEEFLQSTETGPSWYRGYFKGNLSLEEVKQGLKPFGAKAVVVGHTIQWHVKNYMMALSTPSTSSNPMTTKRGFQGAVQKAFYAFNGGIS